MPMPATPAGPTHSGELDVELRQWSTHELPREETWIDMGQAKGDDRLLRPLRSSGKGFWHSGAFHPLVGDVHRQECCFQ
jgi:hypothetical protein